MKNLLENVFHVEQPLNLHYQKVIRNLTINHLVTQLQKQLKLVESQL